MKTSVFISGATGTIGEAITRRLITDGYRVTGGFHTAAKRARVESWGARALPFAWDDEHSWSEALAHEVVVLIAPPGDPASNLRLAPFIDRLATSSCGGIITVGARGIEHMDGISLREIEKHAAKVGLPTLHLRPTWVMQNFTGMFAAPLLQSGVLRVPADAAAVAFVDAEDLAMCVSHWLTLGYKSSTAVTLTGPRALAYAEAVAALGRAARKTFAYESVPSEDYLQDLLSAGVPRPAAEFVSALWTATRAGAESVVSGDFEQFTGRKPGSFEAFAERSAGFWADSSRH